MFDRVGDLAEKLATNVSRRAFLGRLGQGALGLVAVCAGNLTAPTKARADNKQYCVYFVEILQPTSAPVPCYFYPAVAGGCPCGGAVKSNHAGCQKVAC
jgi:hypothetical protein